MLVLSSVNDVCYRPFADKSAMKRDTLIHMNKKPFKCKNCNKEFSCKTTLMKETNLIFDMRNITFFLPFLNMQSVVLNDFCYPF